MKKARNAIALSALSFALWCPPALADGKGVYEAKCKACHGPDGKGNPAMATGLKVEAGALDLTDDTKGKADPELATVISEGKGGKMPAFGGKLTPAEIQEAVTYFKSL